MKSQTTILLLVLFGSCDGVNSSHQILHSASVRGADSNSRDLIVGGNAAPLGRYPYYARLDYEGDFGCGASLIAPDFILTAAHCADPTDVGKATATVGAVSRLDTNPLAKNVTTYRRIFRELFRHPAYEPTDRLNDFALVRIDPVPNTTSTARINRNMNESLVGAPVTAIGCGFITDIGPDAKLLREVEVKVVDDAYCDNAYDGSIHHKSMICAAAPGKDSCDGDSGGPLLVRSANPDPRQDIIIGVVSSGGHCADPTQPGIYAQVSYAAEWIDEVLCQHSMYPPAHCPTKICQDGKSTFVVNRLLGSKSCPWLIQRGGRIEKYCHPEHEAWTACPFTCSACTYQNDDDAS